MAAITMTPPAVRQPFAPLDATRMRSLMRSKMNFQNKQNGLLSSAKRQPLADSESENIDPTAYKSIKRKRSLDDEDDTENDKAPLKSLNLSPIKPMKSSRMAFSILEDSAPVTPSTPTKSQHASTPKSAPLKPAGRSPQMKASKPFARRSTVSKNRPESARKGVSRPFSLAAALFNGKSKSKQAAPASTPKMPMPASWTFEIYVDSEQEEMTNLMQHSTCVLDISDDEGKVETVSDHRGKENIPPADAGVVPARATRSSAAARKATLESDMKDEPRSPLGELNAADYYGEDCHAFSYEVVYDDEEDVPEKEKKTAVPAFEFVRPTLHSRSKLSSMSSIDSVLEDAATSAQAEPETKTSVIEIWESESAGEEAEAASA
ncbi:hypothetical protein BDW69DRAFT_160800 [Aspergillus filifer]